MRKITVTLNEDALFDCEPWGLLSTTNQPATIARWCEQVNEALAAGYPGVVVEVISQPGAGDFDTDVDIVCDGSEDDLAAIVSDIYAEVANVWNTQEFWVPK